MPRKSRVISSTGIYHIVLRSINQHIIFEEDLDYQKFLFILSDCKASFDIDIYAYCLMDNHVHLLLFSSANNLSSFFQSIGTRFVHWYNSKYSRTGHLFQDRFFSVAVESATQFLATIVYIHNNPVEAHMCRFPSEYRWSSHNAFYGEKNPLVNISYSYDIAGSKDLLLKYFSSASITYDNFQFVDSIHQSARHFITDEKALYIFKSITHLSSTSDTSLLNRVTRNEYIRELHLAGLTHKQVARLMDVSISTVKRVINMSHNLRPLGSKSKQ